MSTHYEILGVEETASAEEITRAYRKLARQYHPDRPNGDAARFSQVNQAYTVLHDNSKRASYDAHLRFTRQFGNTDYSTMPPQNGSHNSGEFPFDFNIFDQMFRQTGQSSDNDFSSNNHTHPRQGDNFVFISVEELLRMFATTNPQRSNTSPDRSYSLFDFPLFTSPFTSVTAEERLAKRLRRQAFVHKVLWVAQTLITFLFGMLFGGGKLVLIALVAPYALYYFYANKMPKQYQYISIASWTILQCYLLGALFINNIGIFRLIFLIPIFGAYAYRSWRVAYLNNCALQARANFR